MAIQRIIRVRDLKQEDMPAVFEIECKSFKNPYPLSLLKHIYTSHPDGFLVAELREEVVGYVIGIPRWEDVGHILAVAVDPNFRRQGIGSALIIDMLDRLRGKEVDRVRLEARLSNRGALKFYRRLGFEQYKVVRNYYSDGEAAVLMMHEF